MRVAQPFARMRADILDVMPMLKGCFAQVYMTIGAFEVDPVAPCFGDIVGYSGAAKSSVSRALEFLCKHELAHCFVDENGTKRYRADDYFQYGATESVSIRARIKPSPKFLDCHDDDILYEDSSEKSCEKHHDMETSERKALFSKWIEGVNLSRLAEKEIPRETCEAWANWLEHVDRKRWKNPPGYCFMELSKNPNAQPPYLKETVEKVRTFKISGALAK